MLQRAETAATLAGVDASRAFFERCFSDKEQEALLVAHVDEATRYIHLARYEDGDAGIELPLRQIMSDAAELGSCGLVLAHNHPSGDARPSPSDTQATRRLATAAEAFDISVLDHLIIAGDDCTSMRRLKLL